MKRATNLNLDSTTCQRNIAVAYHIIPTTQLLTDEHGISLRKAAGTQLPFSHCGNGGKLLAESIAPLRMKTSSAASSLSLVNLELCDTVTASAASSLAFCEAVTAAAAADGCPCLVAAVAHSRPSLTHSIPTSRQNAAAAALISSFSVASSTLDSTTFGSTALASAAQ
eukprot:CAMPEP_0181184760 /NCGR_PEP_ID=MMETSP1096-20121128/9141_1 /TAXON_ID=156174 ORGANISM="Chrysochromulina ericina, Strain CCMP281" /NCGR_SAMPLE_ID=MMETSP1096 /ASSEMBLY_ACC=CAM_ASM_000453 /LENGTH=167 /DNA_ID=CAMNT_0023273549 /DNA_START=256 /DNA_END=759 /DNA_ORIENTATION=-